MLAFEVKYDPYAYISNQGVPWNHQAEGSGGDSDHGVPTLVATSVSGDVVSANVSANTLNRARTEARTKLLRGDLSVGVALAESKQTLGFIAKTSISLVQALRHMRRGRWSKAGNALGFKGWKDTKGFAQGWLSYQYAVLPLLSDMYAAQELLKIGLREKDQLFKVSRQVTAPLNPLSAFYVPSAIKEHKGFCKEICRVVYYAKVANLQLHNLASLGLTNPALIAWELVPFSFVVDWLIPIGSFLEAITATQGLTFVAGFEDRIIEVDVSWNSWKYAYLTGTKARGHVRQYTFQRVVKSTWDYSIPYWKNPFSSTHVANAVALLRSTRR